MNLLAILALALARSSADADCKLDGAAAPPRSASASGFSAIAREGGPQAAVLEPAGGPASFVAAVRAGETVEIDVPFAGAPAGASIVAEIEVEGGEAEAVLSIAGARREAKLWSGRTRLEVQAGEVAGAARLRLSTRGISGEAGVLWSGLSVISGGSRASLPMTFAAASPGPGAPPRLPALRKPLEDALLEWDWRLADGIGAERRPATFAEAIEENLRRGDALIRELISSRAPIGAEMEEWIDLRREWGELRAAPGADEGVRDLWRRIHRLKRRIAFRNPAARTGPILFAKQVPGAFSHQLTQYYGRYARPGGGLYVLDAPGDSLACREVPCGLPEGSRQHPDVSWDGRRILFSWCEAAEGPRDPIGGHKGRYYHLYEVDRAGGAARALTSGPFDDFSPKYLPDGRIVFISTRRLGWHRCGSPGCENYTLALAEADGSNPRPISYHETQEWDPAVLEDGRLVYTRWDYVDRHAVHYEQLWTVRPDGTGPAAFYGNNTFNPVGVWEPRPVPGTSLVMATAAAHHAMTAGSIVLVDAGRGVDGLGPIARLTPDVPFPESESTVLPGWRSSVPDPSPPLGGDRYPAPPSAEAERRPGHCYKSPFPLSAKFFLAAYSYDPLIGEPKGNAANMFGLYLADAFGNRELLHRDPGISSVYPIPLAPRRRPPVLPAVDSGAGREGIFVVLDAGLGAPALPPGSVKRLRIVQVLPKSTPGANNPTVGLAHASPGKQVLGTVPVEADGSACFRAPAGIPLAFQSLDDLGRAVQTMRSVTYLQPGETAACIGCHESRTSAPPPRALAKALARPPSTIEPGPDGSRPLSYPILVQPVLDRRCVSCHGGEKPAGGADLTGKPRGRYTASYEVLARRVPFSQWDGRPDFREANSEPVSIPGRFGARGSPLLEKLLAGHKEVRLEPGELERLITWMDANALFYGTFDHAAQARQQRGERIEGPGLE
jgi:hypothetical protein